MSLLVAAGVATVPTATAQHVAAPARTQIAVHFADGRTAGTGNAHEQRSILSLSKLHLGYWVLYHGSAADKARVQHMIAVSDDNIATELDRRYPQAIPEIIRDFGLGQTAYSGHWGTSYTSAHDMARFVGAIRHDPVAAPLLNGMRFYSPIAGDGYPQNFGTVVLPGAQGTKFGWSDNRTIHASVSFGPGWVAAANTYGSAADHTADLRAAAEIVGGGFGGGGGALPGLPEVPGAPQSSPAPANTTSGELLDRASCLDPLGSSQHLPQDIPVPGEIAQFVPNC